MAILANTSARVKVTFRKETRREINKMGKIIVCSLSLICLLFFSFVFLFSSWLEGHLEHGISASRTKI